MQPAHMAFADVQKFRFGADIEASDGVAGHLEFVVADPAARTVTAAGIKPHLFAKTHIVPIHNVGTATADTVNVNIPLAEIEQAPTSPDAKGAVLSKSTSIVAVSGKRLGKLVQLTIHAETQQLRHLVVEQLGREVLVPAPMIRDVTARQIAVDLGSIAPKDLTPYRPDEELRQAALDAIDDYVPLRIDMPGFQVHVIDGVVWLRGHVASDLNRSLVADQLVNIPGIAAIHNELIPDTSISSAVSMALAHDPRTAGERIGVYPRLGTIRLRGNVRTAAARQAAYEIAAAVPGVKDVLNELNVNPREPGVPDLAAVTNREDMVPGGT